MIKHARRQRRLPVFILGSLSPHGNVCTATGTHDGLISLEKILYRPDCHEVVVSTSLMMLLVVAVLEARGRLSYLVKSGELPKIPESSPVVHQPNLCGRRSPANIRPLECRERPAKAAFEVRRQMRFSSSRVAASSHSERKLSMRSLLGHPSHPARPSARIAGLPKGVGGWRRSIQEVKEGIPAAFVWRLLAEPAP